MLCEVPRSEAVIAMNGPVAISISAIDEVLCDDLVSFRGDVGEESVGVVEVGGALLYGLRVRERVVEQRECVPDALAYSV